MLPTKTDTVLVGNMGAPHGIRGGIKVHSYTHPRDRILDYPTWWVQIAGVWAATEVLEHKYSGGNIVVRVPQLNDSNAAKQWSGVPIYIPYDHLDPLGADEFYWHDLIGMLVQDPSGQMLGTVASLMHTGANDVLVVRSGQKEVLVPFIHQVIVDVNQTHGLIVVDWDCG